MVGRLLDGKLPTRPDLALLPRHSCPGPRSHPFRRAPEFARRHATEIFGSRRAYMAPRPGAMCDSATPEQSPSGADDTAPEVIRRVMRHCAFDRLRRWQHPKCEAHRLGL